MSCETVEQLMPPLEIDPDEIWWCNSHARRATSRTWHPGRRCYEVSCAPNLGGITIPCCCVELTGQVEIVD